AEFCTGAADRRLRAIAGARCRLGRSKMGNAGPVPQPGILEISPYVGGESKAPGVARPARLASNENPLGPSPLAIAAYIKAAAELHRYPDGGATELRAAIGRHNGLDPA